MPEDTSTPKRSGNLLARHPWITSLIFLSILFGGYKFMQSSGSTEITPVAPKVASLKL